MRPGHFDTRIKYGFLFIEVKKNIYLKKNSIKIDVTIGSLLRYFKKS